ncbi:MAG: NrfD/PsrC family molybdoenzyme membrane anchor subunit [Candidatus Kapaibacterium sp.]
MQNKIRFLKDVLWFFVFWGIISAIFRMWFGLGATTNLNDQVPWGLWKILNMIAGVALATSGFTIGFLVYVIKLERFRPLLRPAILIAFLGYGSSCLALLFDIGLPYRFWHPFVMWNEHSFLFEVFWCVSLYFTITFIELTPNILERFKAQKITGFLHKITIGVVIFGISLSSLHHSSLGSLFLTTPLTLHELWYTSWLPWMFISSAIAGGLMFLILVKILYARLYDPESVFGQELKNKANLTCSLNGYAGTPVKLYGRDMPMLSRLALIASFILGIYLIMKIYDLFSGSAFNALLAGTWESWLYTFEVLITAVIPIILISFKRVRTSPYGLGAAAFLASAGVALYRVDVGILGYFRSMETVYLPSLAEWSLSLGVFAAAALAFIYISENFYIFDNNWEKIRTNKSIFKASFDSFTMVCSSALQNNFYRVTLIAVFTIPIAFVMLYPLYDNEKTYTIDPAAGANKQRTVLLINGNSNHIFTLFPHEDHKKRLGGSKSCSKCHHISRPNDHSTPCARCHSLMYNESKLFDHSAHMIKVAEAENIDGLHPRNHSCNHCHIPGEARTKDNAAQCIDCHRRDMNLSASTPPDNQYLYADSYLNAMHKNCISCHKQEEKFLNKKISECSTCHKTSDERENSYLTSIPGK